MLDEERNIPYGETRSYSQIAQMVHKPKSSCAVGSANIRNPFPLYSPCHRIIHSNRKLGRFDRGIEVKSYLLSLELQHY